MITCLINFCTRKNWYSGSSIIGMMASKNVKNCGTVNFRFTIEHLLTSIIGIFPKNIPIIEIFFKNPGNRGNFYSIVDLHFFPLLKKFIVDQQSFKKHKSNLSTKYNRPKPQFSHRSPILGIPPPRFWPLCPSIFYAAHAKERWHHHHLEDLSNSTSTRSDGS